jgi:hypothetical protein
VVLIGSHDATLSRLPIRIFIHIRRTNWATAGSSGTPWNPWISHAISLRKSVLVPPWHHLSPAISSWLSGRTRPSFTLSRRKQGFDSPTGRHVPRPAGPQSLIDESPPRRSSEIRQVGWRGVAAGPLDEDVCALDGIV